MSTDAASRACAPPPCAATLVFVSDTHMRHEQVVVPRGDLLVHCGDFTRHGTLAETEAFLEWFAACPGDAKVLVAGNHDKWAEREPAAMHALAARAGVAYLADAETTVAGLRIWGSPVTPAFRSLAFNRARGAEIRAHWDAIPPGLDLLVTHGPPRGLGDHALIGGHVGCDDLLAVVHARAPRLHAFGHIHEATGEFHERGLATRFLNVATSRLLGGVRSAVVVRL